jgi:photosystem II stability/assembly factor-like uncharacterized protein
MRATFEIVNAAADDLGYIGHICKASRHWATGGTHGKATILASDDGRTFERKPAPKANGLRDLLPVEERLVACGEGGALFISDDGAATWAQRTTGTTVCLFTLALDSRGHIWLGGERGFVRRSKDKGDTWSNVVIGTDARVNVIAVVDATVYFACHDGTLFRFRRDRIERIKLKASAPFTSFERTAKGTLVMSGDRGTLFRSSDGTTWEQTLSPEPHDLECVREIQPGVLVCCGDKATVLVSHDEAQTFERVPCNLEGHLWTVCPAPGGALIGGDRGLIAKMDRGGQL